MPAWVIAAALASVAITALLTWILWRMNEPLREDGRRGDGGIVPVAGDGGGKRDADADGDGGSDVGGGGE